MSSLGSYRRKANRCESKKVETNGKNRSWRCDLVAGHSGPHESHSGHRRWDNRQETA